MFGCAESLIPTFESKNISGMSFNGIYKLIFIKNYLKYAAILFHLRAVFSTQMIERVVKLLLKTFKN